MSDEFDEWLRVASGGWPAIRVPPGKPRVEVAEYPKETGYGKDGTPLPIRGAMYTTAHGWWRVVACLEPSGFMLTLSITARARSNYIINRRPETGTIAGSIERLRSWVKTIQTNHKMRDYDFESGPVLTVQTLLEYYDKIRR